MLPFLLERILDEMPAWLYNNNMIKFLIPTAKEMKPSKEVPSQKLSEKSEAILTEMAKLTIVDWAAADGFRFMKEFDRADKLERDGDKKLMMLRRRYQLSRENDARFISLKEFHNTQKAY